ncbi:MFS transporter [Roseovarius aestuarii]|nr:MFS transporter [Roseovarius aestuarii]
MRAGLVLLCMAYALSQFFRAVLAVLGGVLQRDLGAGPADLALASGLWFLTFAVMQLPIGLALDRIGPRLTSAVLLAIGGGGGALVFALATGPAHVNIAMGLIGVGCSPVLMASYYIFARQFPPAQFATLAALMLGIGSLGNLVASYPMALAAEVLGWRVSMLGMACISAAVAAGIALLVKDPERVTTGERGSVLDLLKMRALWPIFPLMFIAYAPAGAIRGLWIGPYLSDVFQLETGQVGQASMVMGVAMIAGALIYGPLDRLFGTQKWVCLIGNLCCGIATLTLAVMIGRGVGLSITLCALIGLFGSSFPMVVAHARGFMPTHLVGRGVTLLNLFGIGGVGVVQFGSGPLHAAATAAGGVQAGYATLFTFFGIIVILGCALYLFSRDSNR